MVLNFQKYVMDNTFAGRIGTVVHISTVYDLIFPANYVIICFSIRHLLKHD